MRTKYKLMIVILLLAMIPIGLLVDGSGSYLMPLFTIVIIGMLVYEYLLVRIALKNGKAIRLGKKTLFRWLKLYCLLFGIGVVVLDIYFYYHQPIMYRSVHSYIYLGLVFIAYALISVKNNILLFKEKGQKRTYYWTESSYWVGPLFSFTKIEKVKIETNKMVLTSKNGDLTYDFLDERERTTVQHFLSSGFGNNLLLKEDSGANQR